MHENPAKSKLSARNISSKITAGNIGYRNHNPPRPENQQGDSIRIHDPDHEFEEQFPAGLLGALPDCGRQSQCYQFGRDEQVEAQ